MPDNIIDWKKICCELLKEELRCESVIYGNTDFMDLNDKEKIAYEELVIETTINFKQSKN